MEKEKIIVIGGLSAGPSAAAKARRENEHAEIILFEKGANISYATCGMPYAFSGIIENREKLIVVKPKLLSERFNVQVKLEEEILDIDPGKKIVTSKEGSYTYDKLIFATGASSIVPPIKGLQNANNWSTCRTMQDYDKIMAEVIPQSAQNITVVGAGLIGVEVAENLREAGKNVTLIEGSNQVLPMWEPHFGYFADEVLKENGVNTITSTFVHEFITENDKIVSVKLNELEHIETDFVILSIGIKPNTDLLTRKGAAHLKNGALLVNEKMETSLPDIYAAGDNTALKNLQTGEYDYFPLGTHSNKGGRAAGANAAGKNIIFKGAYKTAIIKVFNYTLARTGHNAKSLDILNIPYKKVLSIAGATPSYYPNQKDLIIELYYHAQTEEILGAELFGEYGVDKRVDVLSTAIYAKLKVTDLSQLDLAYAPPFSPAKDPVVVTGFMAENISASKCSQLSITELEEYMAHKNENDYILIDVRTAKEYENGHIQNAINLPLDNLRNTIDSIENKNKPIIIYCQKGLRGYIARLIFKNNGFPNVISIAGGYKLWTMHGNLNKQRELSI
jgi:NADPH-dependent 2,4-dienoyl-CoA reductase/sulfur reductase-like enzyme/rhodanese-related sulfurtransferase